MSCNITNGYSLNCKQLAGVREIYIGTYIGNLLTYTTTDNIITSFTKPTDYKLYTFAQDKEVANLSMSGQFSEQNGIAVYTTQIDFTLHTLSQDMIDLITILNKGSFIFLILDNNNNYFITGLKNGCRAISSQMGPNKAYTDLNGTNLSFNTKDTTSMTQVSSSAAQSLLGLAFNITLAPKMTMTFGTTSAPSNMFGSSFSVIAGSGSGSFNANPTYSLNTLFNNPSALALDTDTPNNFWISDTQNLRIRKYINNTTSSTQSIVYTIAGSSSSGLGLGVGDGGGATFSELTAPYGLFYKNRILYICDNSRLRKIDTVTNIITTIAGTSTNGFSGDGGNGATATFNKITAVAVDPGDNILICDSANHRIRRMTGTGTVRTIAGSTQGYAGDGGDASLARFNFPQNIVLDNTFNMYIADIQNSRIRRIDALTNIITTYAGNGTIGVPTDGLLATTQPIHLLANVPGTLGIAFDSINNMYFSDNKYYIRKVDNTTKAISTYLDITSLTGSIADIKIINDNLYFTTYNLNGPDGNKIYKTNTFSTTQSYWDLRYTAADNFIDTEGILDAPFNSVSNLQSISIDNYITGATALSITPITYNMIDKRIDAQIPWFSPSQTQLVFWTASTDPAFIDNNLNTALDLPLMFLKPDSQGPLFYAQSTINMSTINTNNNTITIQVTKSTPLTQSIIGLGTASSTFINISGTYSVIDTDNILWTLTTGTHSIGVKTNYGTYSNPALPPTYITEIITVY